MSHLPRFERRPTTGFFLGQAMGQGCLTSSVLVNLVRLLAFCVLLAGVGILIGGGGAGLVAGAGAVVLVATFAYRPKVVPQLAPPDVWTPKEQRLARAVSVAEAQGSDIGAAIAEAGLSDQLAIDYGTTADDERAICVSQRLRRAHQLTTGGSGSGKSKFIATQAAQGALLGSALAVIDPHEELAADILRVAAPTLAQRGCILIWPDGPSRRIFPWNPLWTGPGRQPWQAADLVVGAVKRVWQLSDKNTYIVDVLKHTAWALAGAGWSLLEGPRFLTDEVFRAYITGRAAIPQVTQWVTRYDQMAPRDKLGLTQTTMVRLNRLHGNPHLARLFGCGVTDPNYRAAMQARGVQVVEGADLVGAINRGHHLFTVIPVRVLGEDQYLVAGLVQASLLAAALSRRPNDPSMSELEMYLDEAAAYANAEGLGRILAQARKYRVTAMVAMQGLHQAEPELAEELRTNTAIKTIFSTDNPDEAQTAASMLFSFDPTAIKMDVRQRFTVGEGQDKRETGFFQTYSPQEQLAAAAGQILALRPRHYYLKIRGAEKTPLMAITPNYTPRYELAEAIQMVSRRRVAKLVAEDVIDRELAARHDWLERVGYGQAQYHSAKPAAPANRPDVTEERSSAPMFAGARLISRPSAIARQDEQEGEEEGSPENLIPFEREASTKDEKGAPAQPANDGSTAAAADALTTGAEDETTAPAPLAIESLQANSELPTIGADEVDPTQARNHALLNQARQVERSNPRRAKQLRQQAAQHLSGETQEDEAPPYMGLVAFGDPDTSLDLPQQFDDLQAALDDELATDDE